MGRRPGPKPRDSEDLHNHRQSVVLTVGELADLKAVAKALGCTQQDVSDQIDYLAPLKKGSDFAKVGLPRPGRGAGHQRPRLEAIVCQQTVDKALAYHYIVIVQITAFSANLVAIRKECQLSQAYIGKLVGVSRQVVWSWEQGRTEPTFEQLARLAQALLCTTDYLLRPPEPHSPR